MPDPAPRKARLRFPSPPPAPARGAPAEPAASDASPRAAAGSGYAELHARTNFSFLEGASHPDELVEQAAGLGYAALAITDRASLAGIVQAHAAARPLGFKLLLGAEIEPVDALPAVLWAADRASYGRLCRLLTLGRRRAEKGACHLTWADVVDHAEGLLAGVLLAPAARRATDLAAAPPRSAAAYREAFGSRAYALAELHRGPDDAALAGLYARWSRRCRLPLVAAGDVHYHVPERRPLHDVLTATRHGCTVAEAGPLLLTNGERHLRPLDAVRRLFAGLPGAVERTLEVASRCRFSLDELRYEYPEELVPAGETPAGYLRRLVEAGARDRYPDGVPDKVRGLVEHELALIEELRYEAYFLTVWDLVRFARGRGILCQGRGSAANSAVCYALGVTSVDPARLDVLFERFVSRERNEAPDIDIDFEHERREEVLQYLYDKYGRDRAALTAEVITYRSRSAVRDVGKALGLPAERIDRLAKSLDGHRHRAEAPADWWQQRLAEAGLDPQAPTVRQFLALVTLLLGFPRHLSQHVGGMVMTRGPLCELAPLENAAMPGRTVLPWDKDDLDQLGILKVDCLALGMLTAIRKALELIERHHGRRLTLATIPAEDPAVYEQLARADTIGVFQIESRAQMSMLPRLRPRCFYDLVIEVAIVRPGPIQGDMVHPYLRRRDGLEPVTYPSEAIRAVLDKTLGVPIFQEQAMRLAVVAAGFTPGEADQLRRAMGAWRRPGVIERFRQKLLDGMQAHGLSREYADRVFKQISGFGEYGFPESHAASFALLVYVSAWLKRYYPAAFCAALVNSQPMGFYAPAQLLRDAREHGVEVRPLDVERSAWDLTLEGNAIRLGFRLVSGLPAAAVARLVEARQAGPFGSFEELARRTGLGQPALVALAKADALGSLGLDRRAALWHALGRPTERPLPLFESPPPATDDALPPQPTADEPRPEALPAASPYEEVLADYRTAGLTLRQHPLAFYRHALRQRGCVAAAELAACDSGQRVRVAGLVLLRQRPSTAKGITFVTLEDETGTTNLILRPDVWHKFRAVANHAQLWLADGRLERQGPVIHVLVERLAALGDEDRRAVWRSRDFH